jgi:LysM repeat protein
MLIRFFVKNSTKHLIDKKILGGIAMKKNIAKTLAVMLVLSSMIVFSPAAMQVSAMDTTPATNVKVDSQVHVVVPGDMMWKIAQMHNLTLAQLMALNPQITTPGSIHVGQKINIGPMKTTPVVNNGVNKVKIYQGFGSTTAFRNGPGADSENVPVYSFNIAMAQATFDSEGRILSAYIDGYEVSTPNYDGASMPHFSGWPDKQGYNVTNHDTEKVTGVSVNTKESAAAEVKAWQTKRERGDSYHMNPANEWYKQMNFFQKFFVGKTVAELKEWYAKNTTAAGRPIKAATVKQDEIDKLAKLTAAEKAALADVVAGATMSISDAHGDFLGALEEAYNNRIELVISAK